LIRNFRSRQLHLPSGSGHTGFEAGRLYLPNFGDYPTDYPLSISCVQTPNSGESRHNILWSASQPGNPHPFSELTIYAGDRALAENFDSRLSEEEGAIYRLRGFHFHNSEDGPDFVQLYVSLDLLNDYSLRHARVLGDRNPREITEIHSDVSCKSYRCKHYETVGIVLAQDEIERGRREGLSVQFSGQGRLSFSIPEWYFVSFLETWEKRWEE